MVWGVGPVRVMRLLFRNYEEKVLDDRFIMDFIFVSNHHWDRITLDGEDVLVRGDVPYCCSCERPMGDFACDVCDDLER
jgi:hypothetical protein